MATKTYIIGFKATISGTFSVDASSCEEAIKKIIEEVQETEVQELLYRNQKPDEVSVTSVNLDRRGRAKATAV